MPFSGLPALVTVVLTGIPLSIPAVASSGSRLTLEQRVAAQESIERIYYAHQAGATLPFEKAVPRWHIERKVTDTLRLSAALERRFGIGITPAMLREEIGRIERETLMPERLREIRQALGDDPLLIRECLARPALVERLAGERVRESLGRSDPDSAARAWDRWRQEIRDTLSLEEAMATVDRSLEEGLTGGGSCAERIRSETAGASEGPQVIGAQCTSQSWAQLSPPPACQTDEGFVWTGSVAVSRLVKFDPTLGTCTFTSTAGQPAWRILPSIVWTGQYYVIWGGLGSSQFLSSGGRYDPATDSWLPMTQASAPAGRWYHSTVWTGTRMIVWGGRTVSTPFDNGGLYDPATDLWTPIPPGGPSARYEHGAVWTGRRMIVWGGRSTAADPLATGAQFDPATLTWVSATSMAGAPDPSYPLDTRVVWAGSLMYVFGGYRDDTLYGSTGQPTSITRTYRGAAHRYDPIADAWSPMAMDPEWIFPEGNGVVSNGRQILAWGGGACSWIQGYPGPSDWHTFCETTARGGIYDPGGDTWCRMTTDGTPAKRWPAVSLWDGARALFWGGVEKNGTGEPSVDGGGAYRGEFDPILEDQDQDGFAPGTGDCDDQEPGVYPGAPENCGDLLNNDCLDPFWPADHSQIDDDGDGMTDCQGDCDDSEGTVRPGAPELCDGLDNDCDGSVSAGEQDPDADGYSVCAGDCDETRAGVRPGGLQICGDGLNNDCAHPAWPSLSGTNEVDDDGDLLSECGGDCDDAIMSAWQRPDEALDLVAGYDPVTDTLLLSWSPPASPGASLLRYDVLRSGLAAEFAVGTDCLEQDDADLLAADPGASLTYDFFYLVRAVNDCPAPLGAGVLGRDSTGAEKPGRTCP